MNQRGFIIPVVVVVVVIAAIAIGAVVYTRSNSDDAGEISSQEFGESGEEQQENGGFTGTVTDLLKRGQNLTCSFSQADEAGNNTNGTVYVAGQGERIRGDFVLTQADGTNIDGHIVRDADFNYFWSDQFEQGTKVTISEEEKAESAAGLERSQQDVFDDNVDYNCKPWLVDASMFELPSDKEFVDISQQLQQINTTTEEAQQAQCSACDQIQGAGKDQCLQALGCN